MPPVSPDTQIRLPNGDILIVHTTERDPQVDAAFKATRDRVREQTRKLYEKYQQARQAA
jgi:ribosome-associated translation inhibitor RaiA